MKKIGFNFRGKKINFEVEECDSFWKKIKGLMFSRRQNAKILLFDFKKPVKKAIHSFFVFFPFYAIWLDKENKILEIKKIPSWKISVKPKKHFVKLIELPVLEKYSFLIRFLDGRKI